MKETIFTESLGFDWDDGNLLKNSIKHAVSWQECEEVFFNEPLLLFDDINHSKEEKRECVLGKTNKDRKLFIVFTMRNPWLRVISARDMNKKERAVYEKNTQI